MVKSNIVPILGSPWAPHTLTHRYQLKVKNGASHQDSIPSVGIYHLHSMWRQRFYKKKGNKRDLHQIIAVKSSCKNYLQAISSMTTNNSLVPKLKIWDANYHTTTSTCNSELLWGMPHRSRFFLLWFDPYYSASTVGLQGIKEQQKQRRIKWTGKKHTDKDNLNDQWNQFSKTRSSGKIKGR